MAAACRRIILRKTRAALATLCLTAFLTMMYQLKWHTSLVLIIDHLRPSIDGLPRVALRDEVYKITALTQLLTQRLELVTDGDPRIPDVMCGDFNSTAPCNPKAPCDRPLEDRSPEYRVRDLVSSPALRLSDRQLETILLLGADIPEKDLIIVSASSANHYDEMQAMFRSLHETVLPRIRNFGLVLFDLGLTDQQRNITRQNCRCQLVPFRFDLFPPHVQQIKCYSWKPLIVRALMAKARKMLIWQDTSVRWNRTFPEIFDRTLRYGQQMLVPRYGDGVTVNTAKQMFDYLDEDVCAFRHFQEIQAAVQLHRHDPLVVEAVLNPWARCGLEESCICPIAPSYIIHCAGWETHRCHRFDQSALTLLTIKLYGLERYKMVVPLQKIPLQIRRHHKDSHYFKTQ